ncbi:hypothetical protein B0H12DRAFT_374017 [Mycena haematopus]|nr:hypothetical protein B0H12DRAFT_374017 [Mycena haematopus]
MRPRPRRRRQRRVTLRLPLEVLRVNQRPVPTADARARASCRHLCRRFPFHHSSDHLLGSFPFFSLQRDLHQSRLRRTRTRGPGRTSMIPSGVARAGYSNV